MRAEPPEPSRPRRGLFGKGKRRGGGAPKAAKGGGKADRETTQAVEKFIATRTGVEAFVEPQTATNPLSVVLVAADGEWIRKRIPDAAWIQKVSKVARMPVYDVGLVGYPKRMREYRRPGRDEPPAVEPG
jgi:hypothetical protein